MPKSDDDRPLPEAVPGAPPEALRVALEQARGMSGPLADRLSAYAYALREHLPHFAEAVDRLVTRLRSGKAGAGAPKVGEPLPPFLLPDEGGRLVALDDLLAAGPVVVAFHRGHWCPYCQINSRALAEIDDRARALGGGIVAITPEVRRFTSQQKQRAGARFPLLSDIDNGYALSLGLAVWLGEEMRAVMTSIGRDLALYQSNDNWLLPIPATFVLSRDGIVRARFVDPDYRRRMETDLILKSLATAAQAP